MHLERMTFEFIETVSSVEDLTQLSNEVGSFLKNVGGEFFIGGQIVFPGGALRPQTLFANYQHDWFQFYRDHHLILEDPAMHHLRRAERPFTWSWMIKTFDLTASEMVVMNEPRNFGLSEGFVIPIYGPQGAIAGFTVSGEFFNPGPSEAAAIQMIINAAYNHALHLTQLFETAVPSKLTKRQRECLNWAQHGKSNQDIAILLGISVDTVKDHIDAAKKVFGVRSRVEAVMAAHRENLLGF